MLIALSTSGKKLLLVLPQGLILAPLNCISYVYGHFFKNRFTPKCTQLQLVNENDIN